MDFVFWFDVQSTMKSCTGFVDMLDIMECYRMLVAGSFDIQFFECMYVPSFLCVFVPFVQFFFVLLKSNTVVWFNVPVGEAVLKLADGRDATMLYRSTHALASWLNSMLYMVWNVRVPKASTYTHTKT